MKSKDKKRTAAYGLTKRALRDLLQPYRRPLNGAWWLAVAGAVLIVVQSALLARLFAGWLAGAAAIPLLAKLLPWLVLCWLLRPVLNYVKERMLLRASVALRSDVRCRLLDSLARLGPARTHYGNDGALSSQVLDQVDALDGYISRYVVQQKLAAFMPVLVAVVACYYSPLAAVLLLCTAPLIPIFMIILGEAAARKNREQLSALAQLSGRFLDLLRGLPTLRRLGAVEQAQRAVNRAAQGYRQRTMKVLSLAFLSTAVLELFASLAIALVAVYLGLGLLGVLPWAKGSVPVPYQGALFILLLAPEFYAPLRQLGSDYHDKAKAEAAMSALLPLLQAQSGEHEGGKPLVLTTAPSVSLEKIIIRGDGGRIRLSETTLQLAGGERVLLAGQSGSGKSSLLQAILGFTRYEGRIAVNGEDYAGLELSGLREQMAYLAQTPPLLPGSIADNLRLSRPDAGNAELQTALQQVELWGLVQRLPQGLNTVLGERGQGLSGGQLQRLALAQVLLRDAPLWLLDEPTAHLDEQTAADIHALLAHLSAGKTLLLVGHNAQHLDWLDRVVTLTPAQENK